MISLFNASAITLLSTLLVWFTSFNVSRARYKYKIQAPAVTGNKVFERIYRVQMNTLENFVIFIPSLWLYAIYMSDKGAGVGGLLWIVGRIWYADSYEKDAKKRGPGFLISMLTTMGLCLGAVYGMVLCHLYKRLFTSKTR
jgi:glutathione S-transferase